jgi:hypothetical protein
MKAILTFVLASFLTISSIAQTTSTVNIIFRGINKGTKNYQVMLDGNSYYSNNNSDNVANYKITLDNLALGTHSLKLYRLKNNDPAYNNRTQTFVYSKNFELRQGYDMNITILPTGRVQFSEQSSPFNNNNQSVAGAQISDYDFNELLQSVQAKRSQYLKVTTVRNAFENSANYFSTAQIRQLLSYVTSERNKLDLVKLSYRGVTDPYNFTQLSDLFSSTAYRNEFNNYVSVNSGQVNNNNNNTARTQMTDYDFNRLLQNVQGQWSQSLKAQSLRDAFANVNNYFSTAQLRQLLPLITSESDRLDLAKLSYRGVTDTYNFAQLADLFYTSTYRNEFNNYISVTTGQGTYNTVKTQMTDYQFNQLLQNVQGQWSQSLKAETERSAFTNTNNYFSTAQIRQLLSLITSESDRLDLAKLSYRTVMDPAYFPQLADLFYNTSYRNEFNNYVSTQGGQVLNATVRTPMTDSNFSVLMLSVRSNLLQVLKVSAERDVFNNPNNFFTTSQIKQLISLINSENNRLELAKLSYRTVTDPANFTQLNDLFKTQANKDALADYIKTNPVF